MIMRRCGCNKFLFYRCRYKAIVNFLHSDSGHCEFINLKKRPTGSLWVRLLGSLSFSLIVMAGFLQPADCIVIQLKQSICTVKIGVEWKVCCIEWIFVLVISAP